MHFLNKINVVFDSKQKELENLNEFQNQVKEVRLQDKLCKQNYHQKTKNLFELMTDANKKTSENLTKTITETSINSNKALEKLQRKSFRIDD